MNVLNGNCQGNQLIDNPRKVEDWIILVNNHDIIVVGVFLSEFYHKLGVRVNGLLHVVQAAVASHCHLAGDVKRKIKTFIGGLLYIDGYVNTTSTYLRTFKSTEVSVVETIAKRCLIDRYIPQIYL